MVIGDDGIILTIGIERAPDESLQDFMERIRERVIRLTLAAQA